MRNGGSIRYGAARKGSKSGKIIVIVLIAVLAVAALFVWYKNSEKMQAFFSDFGDILPVFSDKGNSGKDKKGAKDNANKDAEPEEEPVKLVKDVSVLKSRIEEYIKDLDGTYGIYFVSLEENTEFGINDTEEYVAASTVKVPLNLYLYKQVEEGAVDLQSELAYTSGDKEGGTGRIQYQKIGTKYTIRELSELSIEESDNVATNMLIRHLGRQNFKDYMKEMGGIVVNYDNNLTCPKDMALYLRKVYDLSFEKPDIYGDMINYMKNTIYNDRIPKLLPSGVTIAHKDGSFWDSKYGVVINDVGIVYTDLPYILAVLSKNVNEQEAIDTIGQISKMAYEFMTTDQPMIEVKQANEPAELQE